MKYNQSVPKWEADRENPGILDDQRIASASGSLWLGIIVGLALIAIGFSVLFGTVLPTNRQRAELRTHGIATTATVIAPYFNPFGRRPDPSGVRRVPYTFKDQRGRLFRGRANLPAEEAPREGQPLSIRYFQQDPEGSSRTEYELSHDDGVQNFVLILGWLLLSFAFEAGMIVGLARHHRTTV